MRDELGALERLVGSLVRTASVACAVALLDRLASKDDGRCCGVSHFCLRHG